MTMKLKSTINLSGLRLNPDQIVKASECAALKGGSFVWCCIRNEWIQTNEGGGEGEGNGQGNGIG